MRMRKSGYGDTEVRGYWYNFIWEFSWRGCTCKLVLHYGTTTMTSTWKYARYTEADTSVLCDICGTKYAVVCYVCITD